MERSQRPFSVYRRRTKKKGSFVYYCRFRGEDGQYVSALSTGTDIARSGRELG